MTDAHLTPTSLFRREHAAPSQPTWTEPPQPTDLAATDLTATDLTATDLAATDLTATDLAAVLYPPDVTVEVTRAGLLVTLVNLPPLEGTVELGLYLHDVLALVLRQGDTVHVAAASSPLMRTAQGPYQGPSLTLRTTDAHGHTTHERRFSTSVQFNDALIALPKLGPNPAGIRALQGRSLAELAPRMSVYEELTPLKEEDHD